MLSRDFISTASTVAFIPSSSNILLIFEATVCDVATPDPHATTILFI